MNARVALAVIVTLSLCAAGAGYLIGHAGGGDRAEAVQLGTRLGQDVGSAAGVRRGYPIGFEKGQRVGYKRTYRHSFQAAYAKAVGD